MTICPHCKQTIRAPRSPADHRRFFGVIRAAFHHWNEAHEFQPDSEEHLRKYLLCKAGYRDVTTIPCEFAEHEPAVLKLVALAAEGAVKAAKGHAFIRPHGAGIAVFSAKSIKWDELDQKAFGKVREAVEDVIRAEIGIDPDQLLKEADAAA